MVKLHLSRKNALELIKLKQELGFIDKNLSVGEINKLIDEMVKVPLGTLY